MSSSQHHVEAGRTSPTVEDTTGGEARTQAAAADQQAEVPTSPGQQLEAPLAYTQRNPQLQIQGDTSAHLVATQRSLSQRSLWPLWPTCEMGESMGKPLL